MNWRFDVGREYGRAAGRPGIEIHKDIRSARSAGLERLRSCRATSQSRNGFTLFEAMVTLAIIVVIFGIAASSLRGPSDQQRTRAKAVEITTQASAARAKAIQTGRRVVVDLGQGTVFCDNEGDQPFEFFPNGTTSVDQLCVEIGGQRIAFKVDRLTGRLQAE